MIDKIAIKKNKNLIDLWRSKYGSDSVRIVVNHSKIATIYNDEFKILARGSMNLNFNPRFEQFDITEGGEDFELIKSIENELPILADSASSKEIQKACKLEKAFQAETLELFDGVKIWNK